MALPPRFRDAVYCTAVEEFRCTAIAEITHIPLRNRDALTPFASRGPALL